MGERDATGLSVGDTDGVPVVGTDDVGEVVGCGVGDGVGCRVGLGVDGVQVGTRVGFEDAGASVGELVQENVQQVAVHLLTNFLHSRVVKLSTGCRSQQQVFSFTNVRLLQERSGSPKPRLVNGQIGACEGANVGKDVVGLSDGLRVVGVSVG